MGDKRSSNKENLWSSKPPWQPRSPDLRAADFSLWGALKGKVYENNPKSVSDLQQNIKDEIAKITVDTLGWSSLFFHTAQVPRTLFHISYQYPISIYLSKSVSLILLNELVLEFTS